MKSQITNVRIDLIDANPWRSLSKYPYVATKVDALVRSIKDVGLWEGVIARKTKGRYQLAFGHHRIEAARKARLKTVPLIVRDLDDEQMLGFMGRENLEDYNADFLCMLESWSAAYGFHVLHEVHPTDATVARTLGWTRSAKGRSTDIPNATATACALAHPLIRDGHLTRDDFNGLSTRNAGEIAAGATANMKALDKAAKMSGRPKAQTDAAKRQVAKGAKTTAKQIKRGDIRTRDIRGSVDTNAYRQAAQAKKRTPLFARFGTTLANQIDGVFEDDAIARKVDEIVGSLSMVEFDEDKETVKRIINAIDALAERVADAHERMVKGARKSKVIDLATQRKLLGGG